MLKDLLETIDEYQFIKIQYRGDILYKGQRRYFIPDDIHNNICITNILCVPEDDISMDDGIPYITICVDRGFN